MNRITTISAALLAAFVLSPAEAAPVCAGTTVDGSPVLTCSEAGSEPISDNRDDLQVRIETGAGISSSDRGTPPLNLGGDNQRVVNDGLIQNTDARNNTDAIAVGGGNLSIINNGEIRSGDRAIQVLGGEGGLSVENYGEIQSRRQVIRSLEGFENAEVINHGLIESQDGRALQLRGDGARVINYGTLLGGEEVVEARGNFYMENHGDVVLREGVDDEDGVQFASGELHNWGLIRGSDDGVDIDEGLVRNYATGRILSTGEGGSGIDIDPLFENGVDAVARPSGPLTIINEGYIEGPQAIGADPAGTSSIDITNSGILNGRNGIAIALAPGQGDSTLKITGGSKILGDVLFGAGDDSLFIDEFASDTLGTGVFDGGQGVNSVYFMSYALTDLFAFMFDGDRVEFSLATAVGEVGGVFRNFGFWSFQDGERYDTLALASRFGDTNAVPTPATLPLLLGALGGLWVVGRRRSRV